jgi:two-component system, sensor histidine kinase
MFDICSYLFDFIQFCIDNRKVKWWRDLSIAKKLYFVVGIMAVLIAGELLILRFSMTTLSALRAFVEAEGNWSKSQKNSAFSLQRYAFTQDEGDYQDFLKDLRIPEGDHQARVELQKPQPNLEVVRDGFLKGSVDPDDIDPIISLFRRFSRVSYLARAIQSWTEGDRLLAELRDAGIAYHDVLHSTHPNDAVKKDVLVKIRSINEQLTTLEQGFSQTLGEGSRWLERVVISLLFLAVLMVESIGLTLTFRTSRQISKGLSDLNDAAGRMGRGDFSHILEMRSKDEIGTLTKSINEMGSMLKGSYRELEKRVEERTLELDDALRVRDEFMSIASHELKTPLSALFLQLQLILRYLQRGDTEYQQRAFELSQKAIKQGEKLKILIEGLLDLTRIRAGKLQLERDHCDLRQVMEEAIVEVSALSELSKPEIRLESPHQLIGKFDVMRITQVMSNLLSNALKYGQGKPIEIFLTGRDHQVEIRVCDQGIGIPADKQNFIFERFERAVSGGGISGLGLGLYITRQIIEAHGGTISVVSSVGNGSEFKVILPLV